MITIIGEDSGGVFGGKRGILSTKDLQSQPLRQLGKGAASRKGRIRIIIATV